MNTVYLLLGTNLGDKRDNLRKAIDFVNQELGEVLGESPIYETEPWGEKGQPSFYNMAVKINTSQSPIVLMQKINEIENKMGRVRTAHNHWKERLIDIDILFFNDWVIINKTVYIPHPRLHLRNFTLVPMAALAPELIHPVLGLNIAALLACTPDSLGVFEVKKP